MELARIIFMRHASTLSNDKRILSGLSDHRLSERGTREVDCICKWIADYKVTAIVTSPKKRCIDTCEPISKVLQLNYSVDTRLSERDYGNFEGLGRSELIEERKRRGLSVIDPTQDWDGVLGVESDSQVWDRVSHLIHEHIDKNSGVTLLLVTHAGVIKSSIYQMLKIPSQVKGAFKITNGSLTQLRQLDSALSTWEMIEFFTFPCSR